MAWLLLVGLLAAPGGVFAEGSGGSGGATGRSDDWPCSGCITVTPPGYDPSRPVPVIFTLHGDEGDPGYIHDSFREPAAEAGFLLVSLQCPSSLGCRGSWWRWQGSSSHDDFDWVHAQIDAVEAAYNVERDQVYATGFSGGAEYLSALAANYTDRFAGALYLGGGGPWGLECGSCQIPVHFVIGDGDFLLDYAMGLRDFFEGCGHDVDWELVPGVGHEIIRSRLPGVLEDMGARRHACRAPSPLPDAGAAPPPTDAGATPSPVDAGSVAPSGDAGLAPGDAGTTVPSLSDGGDEPLTSDELRLVGDCAAAPGPVRQAPTALLWLLIVFIARRTAARAKRSSAATC